MTARWSCSEPPLHQLNKPSMEGRSRDRPMFDVDSVVGTKLVAFNGGAVT